MTQEVGRKLFLTVVWLLPVPACLLVGYVLIWTVEAESVRHEAFGCARARVASAIPSEPPQPDQDRSDRRSTMLREIARIELEKRGQNPNEYVFRMDFVTLADEVTKTCPIIFKSDTGIMLGVGKGRLVYDVSYWDEALFSLLAFVPLGLLFLVRRWFRWLTAAGKPPSSPS